MYDSFIVSVSSSCTRISMILSARLPIATHINSRYNGVTLAFQTPLASMWINYAGKPGEIRWSRHPVRDIVESENRKLQFSVSVSSSCTRISINLSATRPMATHINSRYNGVTLAFQTPLASM